MEIIIITVIGAYILIARLLSKNWFHFCKCEQKKQECRNISCVKAKECPFNTLYVNK